MTRAAVVKEGVVVNVVQSSAEYAAKKGFVMSETAQMGDLYDSTTGAFTTPESAEEQEPPSAPAFTYKTDVWLRCTDDEAERLDGSLQDSTVRMRRMWDDCLTIEHDSDLFQTLKNTMINFFGADRTAEILAPSQPV